MAEITKKNLVLGFSNAAGKAVKLTIKEPAEGLDAKAISGVMDEIIESEAFGEGSAVTTKESAQFVIQQVDKISL